MVSKFKLFKKKKKQENAFHSFSIADQLAPMRILQEDKFLMIGEYYETTIGIVDFPRGNQKSLGWLSELYDLDGNISFNFHVTPADISQTIKNIDKANKKLKRYLLNPKLEYSQQKSYKNELKSLETTIDKLLDRGEYGFFSVGMSIKVQGATKKEMEVTKRRVESKVGGLGLNGHIPIGTTGMLDAFKTNLPFVEDHLERYTAREMDAIALSTMLPFDSQDFGVKTGFAVGINPQSKQQVNVDIRALVNHNLIFLGESGQGKSKTLWIFASRLYVEGCRVIIIDPEDEYSSAVRKMGGTAINVSNGTRDIINPLEVFTVKDDEDETKTKQDYFSLHLQKKEELTRLLVPSANEVTIAKVGDALEEVYKDFKIYTDTDFSKLTSTDYPTFENWYNKIEERTKVDDDKELTDFLVVFKKYVTGINKNIFNGHTNVDLSNPLISFNIKELGTGTVLQTAVMSNITQYIWSMITNDIKETYFFMDELHVMVNPRTPQTNELVKDIYKRIRKFGESGAISASQQPIDLLAEDINGINAGKAVFENSAIQILLPMKTSAIQTLREKASINFSQEELEILTPQENKVGQGLLLYANKKGHVQFQLTEKEWEILGATPKEAEVV